MNFERVRVAVNQKASTTDAATRASRKTDKSAKTRQALIREALHVISNKGVESTSVLEIAQQLGISHGTFYYHFQNMDHLLEEVGHSVMHSLIEKIGSIQRDDSAAQIVRGPLIVHHYAKEHPQLRTIILRVVLDLEGRHGDIKDALREDISQGVKSERFTVEDIDLKVEFAARMVGAMLRLTATSENGDHLARLTAIDTLVLLGINTTEAQGVVDREWSLLEIEFASLDSDILKN